MSFGKRKVSSGLKLKACTLSHPRRDFKLGLKGGNSTQVQTEIVDIDRLAVPVLKLT